MVLKLFGYFFCLTRSLSKVHYPHFASKCSLARKEHHQLLILPFQSVTITRIPNHSLPPWNKCTIKGVVRAGGRMQQPLVLRQFFFSTESAGFSQKSYRKLKLLKTESVAFTFNSSGRFVVFMWQNTEAYFLETLPHTRQTKLISSLSSHIIYWVNNISISA